MMRGHKLTFTDSGAEYDFNADFPHIKAVVRGKRAELIGFPSDSGIIWLNMKTNKCELESYEDELATD